MEDNVALDCVFDRSCSFVHSLNSWLLFPKFRRREIEFYSLARIRRFYQKTVAMENTVQTFKDSGCLKIMPAMNQSLFRQARAALLALSACAAIARADTSTFRLYKLQQEVGREEDSITKTGGAITTETVFAYTDRGTKVPLNVHLQCTGDHTPSAFAITGSGPRSSLIDIAIEIRGRSASIRDGKTSRVATACACEAFRRLSRKPTPTGEVP
jgi:hypothetical protein